MSYSRPEMSVIGDARELVLFGGVNKNPSVADACENGICPAYEIDD